MKLEKTRWALVTGASSGIGKEIALEVARCGMNVVLVGRRVDQLKEVALNAKQHGVETREIQCDLTNEPSIQCLLDGVSDVEISLLVTAAGQIDTGHLVNTDARRARDSVILNTLAPMVMAQHFGAQMVTRGEGTILLVSSLFGFQPVPVAANYSATKAYILSLGEALANELKPFGVNVHVLAPGLTRTNMPDDMPMDMGKMPLPSHSAQQVARAALAAPVRQRVIVPGRINRMFAAGHRFVPRRFLPFVFGKLMRRALHIEQKDKLIGLPKPARKINANSKPEEVEVA